MSYKFSHSETTPNMKSNIPKSMNAISIIRKENNAILYFLGAIVERTGGSSSSFFFGPGA